MIRNSGGTISIFSNYSDKITNIFSNTQLRHNPYNLKTIKKIWTIHTQFILIRQTIRSELQNISIHRIFQYQSIKKSFQISKSNPKKFHFGITIQKNSMIFHHRVEINIKVFPKCTKWHCPGDQKMHPFSRDLPSPRINVVHRHWRTASS